MASAHRVVLLLLRSIAQLLVQPALHSLPGNLLVLGCLSLPDSLDLQGKSSRISQSGLSLSAEHTVTIESLTALAPCMGQQQAGGDAKGHLNTPLTTLQPMHRPIVSVL